MDGRTAMNLQNDKIEPLFDGRNASRESLWGRIQCEARVAVRDEPLLGALIAATGITSVEAVEAAIDNQLAPKLREKNKKLLKKTYEVVKEGL